MSANPGKEVWSVVIVQGRLAYSVGLWMRFSCKGGAEAQVRWLGRLGVQAVAVHADLLDVPRDEAIRQALRAVEEGTA